MKEQENDQARVDGHDASTDSRTAATNKPSDHHPLCHWRVMGSGLCTCADEVLADWIEQESW